MSIGKIRLLNDQLRKTFTGGRVLLTIGVRALNDNDCAELLSKVKNMITVRIKLNGYGHYCLKDISRPKNIGIGMRTLNKNNTNWKESQLC